VFEKPNQLILATDKGTFHYDLNLKQGMPVALAADTVGFNSVTYFSSSFKKHFTKTPKQYSDEKG